MGSTVSFALLAPDGLAFALVPSLVVKLELGEIESFRRSFLVGASLSVSYGELPNSVSLERSLELFVGVTVFRDVWTCELSSLLSVMGTGLVLLALRTGMSSSSSLVKPKHDRPPSLVVVLAPAIGSIELISDFCFCRSADGAGLCSVSVAREAFQCQ